MSVEEVNTLREEQDDKDMKEAMRFQDLCGKAVFKENFCQLTLKRCSRE